MSNKTNTLPKVNPIGNKKRRVGEQSKNEKILVEFERWGYFLCSLTDLEYTHVCAQPERYGRLSPSPSDSLYDYYLTSEMIVNKWSDADDIAVIKKICPHIISNRTLLFENFPTKYKRVVKNINDNSITLHEK
jgi:hypothetical protein